MSHETLASLLRTLAEEVDGMPQREYSAPAWARAGRVRRRRLALGAAAAVLVVGVPVALTVLRGDEAPTGDGVVSQAPLRARAAHTATLLPDGRVLVVGGCATDGCTTAEGSPTTEFYVASQGFTAGPELIQPRQGHTATLLRDGRVLVTGGWATEGRAPLDSAEVYDPATGRFAAVGSLSMGRGGANAVPLADGRVLIAGGQTAGGASTSTTEIYDPATGTFAPAAPMPQPRDAAVATALPDGRVLVAGGQDSEGDALASAVLYDPDTDSWQPTGPLSTPRNKAAAALLPDGRVLILGGTPDDRQRLSTTEFYDPGTEKFAPGPPMDVARYKFSLTIDADGRIVVAGDTQVAVFDGQQFHTVAGTAGPVRWFPTVTSLPNGDVLIVGGYGERIDLYDDALVISASRIAQAVG